MVKELGSERIILGSPNNRENQRQQEAACSNLLEVSSSPAVGVLPPSSWRRMIHPTDHMIAQVTPPSSPQAPSAHHRLLIPTFR
ncbi:hypothetical protein B0T21DRAFT_42204 [Apiosordaria backusii]|uniref:Uncharacterized protein n=1 Tax=Apiosordaria backusii TaxID=314023 RepID=A0AA40AXC0_9PEZI|nr:hypothetical protein B0T21DRAFT_42204 [Apiosordaria backusii]